MRTLSFIVKEQNLSKNPTSNFDGIVAGTKGYLKASFEFNSTWKGYACIAVFRSIVENYPTPLINGECVIPHEVLNRKKFYVKIIGKNINGDILTTNEIEINQKVGGIK